MKRWVLFSGIMFAAVAQAQTTRIVDQGGGGDHTTIGAAVTAAVNGDTIKVIAGTYSEAVTTAKKLIFVGQSGAEVVSGSDAFVFANGSEGSVLTGFTLRGRVNITTSNLTTEANRITIANNVMYDDSMVVRGIVSVVNNTIYRLNAPGIGIWYQTQAGGVDSTAVIFGNTLRKCEIRCEAGRVDIVANKVDDYSGTGINFPYVNSGITYGDMRIVANQVDSCTTGMYFANCNVANSNRVIGNNLITNCATGLTVANAGQPWQAVFHNNVIYNSSSAGISGTSTPSGSTFNFYGNILHTCGGNVALNNAIWDYNTFFNAGTVPSGLGNISSNPNFTDIATRNFNLQVGSPGIDTGHPAAIYTDVDKTRNDMGIYGGPYWFQNFVSGSWPKVIMMNLIPTTVIQGNNVTIKVRGISQ